MSKNTGFTLIELMVTIVILAVMASFAIPSFTQLSASNRLAGAVNELNGAVSAARSEAVKRRAQVTIAPSASGWTSGWSVTVGTGADKEVLLKSDSQAKGITIDKASSTDPVVFTPNGYTVSPNPWSGNGVIFCDASKKGKKISIKRSGTLKVSQVDCS